MDVINFDRVDMAAPGHIVLSAGPEGATVSGDANLLEFVRVEVRNRVLVIDVDPDRQIEPTLPIEVSVGFEDLVSVELSGSGSLTIRDWQTDRAEVTLSGAGDMVIEVVTGELEVHYPGAGSITVSGEAGRQTVIRDGLGPYLAGDLRTSITTLDVEGVGDVEVWAEAEFFYDVTGQGQVRYWGMPTADGQISSQGGLVALGAKEPGD